MITTLKKFAKVIFILDLALILYGIIFESPTWVLNTQVAFLSSLFVSLATFFSYHRSIQKRLENATTDIDTADDRDKIDEIDDPYDLYSEEGVQEEKELSASEIKQIIQEEKSKVKRHSIKNAFANGGSFVSLYRILGYGILIVGFFILLNHQLFMPIAYMIGLFVTPLSMILLKFVIKEEEEDQS